MRAKEVVMGYEKSSKRDGATGTIKAVRGFHVVFVGSIEALNKLFKGSELF